MEKLSVIPSGGEAFPWITQGVIPESREGSEPGGFGMGLGMSGLRSRSKPSKSKSGITSVTRKRQRSQDSKDPLDVGKGEG